MKEHLFVLCPPQLMILSEHSVYLLLLLVHSAVHGARLDFPGIFSDNYHAWSKCSSYCQRMSMSLKISFPFKATKQLWQPTPKNLTRSLAMTPWKRVNRQLFFMTMAQPRWWRDLSGSHCWVERIEYLDLVDLHLGHLRVVDLAMETVQILLTSQTKLKLSPAHKCNVMQCNAIVFKLPQPLCHFRIQGPQHLFWTIS